MIAAVARPKRRPTSVPHIDEFGAGFAPGLRFVEVRGDFFEPVVRRGDFVLVAPVERWSGEADYLFELYGEPALYRCSALGGAREKPIRLSSPNPRYREPQFWSRAEFDAAVTGVVAMTCTVMQPALLREFAPIA